MVQAEQCAAGSDGSGSPTHSTRDGRVPADGARATPRRVSNSRIEQQQQLKQQQAPIGSAAAQPPAAGELEALPMTGSEPRQRAAALGAQQPCQPLHTGLLLELPDPALEAAFWSDEDIGRRYAVADLFTGAGGTLGNAAAAKMLAPALASGSAVPGAWQLWTTVLGGLLAYALTLGCILARPKTYIKHRQAITIANRLLLLALLLLACWARTQHSHAALAAAVRGATPPPDQHQGGGQSVAVTGLLNLMRPLLFGGVVHASQGDWVLKFRHWLPLQVTTLVMACHALRFQPHALANDPHIALILQATCRSFSQVHHLVLGSLLGIYLLPQAIPAGGWADAACGDLLTAARAIAWWTNTAFILVIPCTVYWTVEWRLKSAWARKQLNVQLCYGPLSWFARDPPSGPQQQQQQQEAPGGERCSSGSSRSAGAWLTRALLQLAALSTALWLLWLAVVWLAPRLPAAPQEVVPCVESAVHTCPSLDSCAPADSLLCQDPGLITSLAIVGLTITTLVTRQFIHRFIMGLL